jgi:hypothetical protein
MANASRAAAKSPRKTLTTFAASLEELAVDASGHADLTKSEKEELRRNAEQLMSCVESLANIIDAHDSKLGFRHAPYVGGTAFPGHEILCCALSAAFMIGSRAIINPIKTRLDKEAKKASVAHARLSEEKESEAIDKAILDLAAPIWKLRPSCQKSAGLTASAIRESLNKVLDRPLRKDTIERRVRNLMKSGRLHSHPAIFRTDEQSSA